MATESSRGAEGEPLDMARFVSVPMVPVEKQTSGSSHGAEGVHRSSVLHQAGGGARELWILR